MFSAFISRYLANPDVVIHTVNHDRIETVKEKPSIALSAIP